MANSSQDPVSFECPISREGGEALRNVLLKWPCVLSIFHPQVGGIVILLKSKIHEFYACKDLEPRDYTLQQHIFLFE